MEQFFQISDALVPAVEDDHFALFELVDLLGEILAVGFEGEFFGGLIAAESFLDDGRDLLEIDQVVLEGLGQVPGERGFAAEGRALDDLRLN